MALSWMDFTSRPSPLKRDDSPDPKTPNTKKQLENFWSGLGENLGNFFSDASKGARDASVRQYEEDARRMNPFLKEQEQQHQVRERQADSGYGLKGAAWGERRLTDDEFNSLSSLQQQAVLANTALTRARQADRNVSGAPNMEYQTVFERVFGSDENVEKAPYAPNTVRVLDDLGIRDTDYDLNVFLKGLGSLSYDEMIAGNNEGTLFEMLSSAPVFRSESVQQSLQKGNNLIQALRGSDPVVAQTFNLPSTSGIPEDRYSVMNEMLERMADKQNYEWVKTDPAVNQEAKTKIGSVIGDLDQNAVAQYLLDVYPEVIGNREGFMTLEEFRKNWLQQGGIG